MKKSALFALALSLLLLSGCAAASMDDPADTLSVPSSSVSEVQTPGDTSDYLLMSIAQARAAAEGIRIQVEGVVVQLTYDSGRQPSGIYLADNTNSILIHDRELAGQVQPGNRITIVATKAYWILDSEQSYAEQFGYQGSCQLENAMLISNDGRTDNAYDHSWIPETTLKDLLDTPVTENFTTSICKVQAMIEKRDDKDYTNYYFLDLDCKTGSYVYTQCDGADFAWLNIYAGKICTVYLSVINAKSTEAGCIYRLQPIAVYDEGFTFSQEEIPAHIIKYYAIDQFQSTYSGDPAQELVTSVSSELLDFADASLTYHSSDSSVLKFQEYQGKLYLRGIQPGTVTVTITGSYLDYICTETLEVTIGATETCDCLSVTDVIAASDGQDVTVQGIVGPTLVNQSGFYLMDDSGIIAVNMESDQLRTLKTGHEVIIQGVRQTDNAKNGPCHGQSCIKNASIVTNHYGTHSYEDSYFITDKGLKDFYNLDVMADHSTSVYVLTGRLQLIQTDYYSSWKFTDGSTTITIYCADADQYSFLYAYTGQEVTLEIAPCNWNSKKFYAGCVLAVRTDSGKIIHELDSG